MPSSKVAISTYNSGSTLWSNGFELEVWALWGTITPLSTNGMFSVLCATVKPVIALKRWEAVVRSRKEQNLWECRALTSVSKISVNVCSLKWLNHPLDFEYVAELSVSLWPFFGIECNTTCQTLGSSRMDRFCVAGYMVLDESNGPLGRCPQNQYSKQTVSSWIVIDAEMGHQSAFSTTICWYNRKDHSSPPQWRQMSRVWVKTPFLQPSKLHKTDGFQTAHNVRWSLHGTQVYVRIEYVELGTSSLGDVRYGPPVMEDELCAYF